MGRKKLYASATERKRRTARAGVCRAVASARRASASRGGGRPCRSGGRAGGVGEHHTNRPAWTPAQRRTDDAARLRGGLVAGVVVLARIGAQHGSEKCQVSYRGGPGVGVSGGSASASWLARRDCEYQQRKGAELRRQVAEIAEASSLDIKIRRSPYPGVIESATGSLDTLSADRTAGQVAGMTW